MPQFPTDTNHSSKLVCRVLKRYTAEVRGIKDFGSSFGRTVSTMRSAFMFGALTYAYCGSRSEQ